MRTTFDIETIAKPLTELEALIPEFDPESVKFGNTKDEAKRAVMVEEARKKHRDTFIRDAALNPVTSTCKMGGTMEDGVIIVNLFERDYGIASELKKYGSSSSVDIVPHRDESSMLQSLLARLRGKSAYPENLLVSYFGNNWDLPYLHRRAWLNGVAANPRIFRKGRYYRDNVVDLYDEWGMGERFPSTGGLKGLAKMLKCPSQKEGDGMMFGDLYAKDPCAALDYLINDLRVTDECAERMGVV